MCIVSKQLARAREQSCVVFYSYNSPCVKTCLQSADNIMEGLRNWINKRKDKINAFVFQEIWQKDKDKDLQKEFQNIDKIVPFYRFMRISNAMECRKCVKNNDMDPFCLLRNKLFLELLIKEVFFFFQELLTSRFKVQGFFICHIINYTGYNQKLNVSHQPVHKQTNNMTRGLTGQEERD